MARLGSLNALEGTEELGFWQRWLEGDLPSADSMGRVSAAMDIATVRSVALQVYSRLKRNKSLPGPWHGLMPLVLDGHESHATYRRHCAGCLEREVETNSGTKTQYYHRHVSALLITKNMPLHLDSEPQRPGEDEITCALRLLERILEYYPRAFDVILGDALYTDPRLYNFLIAHGKDVMTVLKDDRRNLIQDAIAIFGTLTPQEFYRGKTKVLCWDATDFNSWPQVNVPVRVVRTVETTNIRRQLDGQLEELQSKWMWVTTLSPSRASSQAAVALGHSRWDIENRGFNETVTYWYADHVYKHDPAAILVFLLLCMVACTIFHAFFSRNLKPALRARTTMLMVSRWILAELLAEAVRAPKRPP